MEDININSNLIFAILFILDFMYLDYLFRGDKPGFMPLIVLFLGWLLDFIFTRKPKREQNDDVKPENPIDINNWNNRVPIQTMFPITTSVDEIFRQQAEALKNAESERASDRIHFQRHLDKTEQKFNKFETWRLVIKLWSFAIIVLHLYLFRMLQTEN